MESYSHVDQETGLAEKSQLCNCKAAVSKSTVSRSSDLSIESADDDAANSGREEASGPNLKRITDYLCEHWVKIISSIVCGLSLYFFTNIVRDLGRLEGKVEAISDSMRKMESNTEKIQAQLHSHELRVQENRLKIEAQGKKAERSSIAQQIEELAKLKEKGILSNEEFEEKKKNLLSKM
jgi:hypothetical protein